MPEVTIENPVINSAFREPARHFRFSDEGITDEVVETRRASSYFVPIPPPKKRGVQPLLPADWTADRIQTNDFINRVRERVAAWRIGGYPGVTRVTQGLLDYWRQPDRERPLFFCQIEALETAIYLAEVAPGRDPWIESSLRDKNEGANPGLYRVAFKMATGTGKTVVMAMLIAWQTLNKLANPQDKRFADCFLVVTPGITIRDRLRVLLPNDPGNYYAERDLVTPDQLRALNQAKIEITNYHAFIRRETIEAAALTKKILVGRDGDPGRFKETEGQMVRRIAGAFGNKRNVVVLNDEAHHCYQDNPASEDGPVAAEDREEAKQNEEAARVWLTGLRAVKAKLGVRAIYDLSATPFFLSGSGYPEGTLFPWVVSDFSLIDAIESGIVKIPRVPVADNQMKGAMPAYRDLWFRIRDELPRRGRTVSDLASGLLPDQLEGALRTLYDNYAKAHRKWEQAAIGSPPVFIVVCNNTAVSKMVYDWIAGAERTLPDGTTAMRAGELAIFSNEENGGRRARPVTILIDSVQLESGEGMDPSFKKIAAAEIDEFKADYLRRFPGRDAEAITDEDLLREVMNTVGKPGRLGEHVKCVVSVSMLTEGWDATTVTHILGVRRFGTQLLCEQVVGRGLRRTSYDTNKAGMFEPQYAEVYGVPFSFIPTAGQSPDPQPPKPVHRVRALAERASHEVSFPHVIGYRYELPADHLTTGFTRESDMALSPEDVPTIIELDPIVGEGAVHRFEDLPTRRLQEVVFVVAKRALEYFRDADGAEKPWLFPQLVAITRGWLADHVRCKDDAFPQMLLLAQLTHEAARKVYLGCVAGSAGEKRLLPILRPYDETGSTAHVDFTTTKSVYPGAKCHLSYVVADSDWEHKLAQTLDGMPEVEAYAKNQGLGFLIPYTFEGGAANYMPDFIVRVRDGGAEPLNLIVEVTGERRKDKAAKVAAAATLWVPAVNSEGRFGRWAFLEVTDPYEAGSLIRAKFGLSRPVEA